MEVGVAHTHIIAFGGVCTRCRLEGGGVAAYPYFDSEHRNSCHKLFSFIK